MNAAYPSICFIGAGNMAASLIGGLIADHYPASKIWISDPAMENLIRLRDQFNVNISSNNKEAVALAEIIVLAVKPQIVKDIAKELESIIHDKKPLLISIAAGITSKNLLQWFGDKLPVVRCMPNTPALIKCGATGLYANNFVNSEQREIAESILRSVGLTVWVEDELLMDAITALSGSGPAYFFLIMEILEEVGINLGLSPDAARILTLQTALGASRLAMETKDSSAQLRKRVTSPGGTTESAINVLQKNNLKQIFTEALTAAKTRAEELGGG